MELLLDIDAELHSLTSVYQEANEQSIQKLDSVVSLYKTYQKKESTKSGKVTPDYQQHSLRLITKTIPNLNEASSAALSPSAANLKPSSIGTALKKTFRSIIGYKKQLVNVNTDIRISSGAMTKSVTCLCSESEDDYSITPTNSCTQLDTALFTQRGVSFSADTYDRNGRTAATYNRPVEMGRSNSMSSEDSIWCNCQNTNKVEFQSSSSDHSDCTGQCGQTECVDAATQNFARDSCCCEPKYREPYHEQQQVFLNSNDAGLNYNQNAMSPQMCQMAIQLAHQIAQQMVQMNGCTCEQQYGCDSMGMGMGYAGIAGMSANSKMGGMPQVPFSSYDETVGNCLDINSIIQSYSKKSMCKPPMMTPVSASGYSSGLANDVIHNQTVYSTDYKPFIVSTSFGSMGQMNQMNQMGQAFTESGFGCPTPLCSCACDCRHVAGMNPLGDLSFNGGGFNGGTPTGGEFNGSGFSVSGLSGDFNEGSYSNGGYFCNGFGGASSNGGSHLIGNSGTISNSMYGLEANNCSPGFMYSGYSPGSLPMTDISTQAGR